MESYIDAPTLHGRLLAHSEIALIDVREALDFSSGHINLARHVPLSSLELTVCALVPRLGTPIVLCDGGTESGDDFALRSWAILTRLGFADVRVLHGGVASWREHGYVTSVGYGTFVRSFADQVRVRFSTPTITPEELNQRFRSGRPTTVIDARPKGEFAYASIPNARNYPGVELPTRRLDAPDPDHLWVITCFSRTRGAIGTTTMRVLRRIENVAFLEDGVMSWFVHGFETRMGATAIDDIPEETPKALREISEKIIGENGLKTVTPDLLQKWRRDDERTLYMFDVRQPDSGSASMEPGVMRVPGGQLLMHYDLHVVTRRARVVLIDDDHALRATVTGYWLTQLADADIYILRGQPLPMADLAHSFSRPTHLGILASDLFKVTFNENTVVVDVGPSADYEKQHLPAAYFMLSSKLPDTTFPSSWTNFVFVSKDGTVAELVARDAVSLGMSNVRWLIGGTNAWVAEGLPTESHWTQGQLLTPFLDDWGSVMRLAPDRRAAIYPKFLAWERAIASQMASDQTINFQFFDRP